MLQRRTWSQTLRRAAAMSPDEAATRLTHFLRQQRDALRIAAGVRPPVEPELAEPVAAGRFFFDAEDIPGIVAELKARLPQQAARVLDQASKIRGKRFDLLGYEDLDFGDPIDWRLDPVSGKRAPQIPWHRVPYLDYGAVGDHKVTWELSRQQHLVTLAKAWWLRRDDEDLKMLCALWREWVDANPYGVGINWASSLEVAFRSLSWLWVLHLLPPRGPVPPDFHRSLVTELGRSARHIERYLSTYFAPNTHLLGEAVALFFVGTLCPRFRSARRWREFGWRILLEQAEKQVRSDGLHFEQSIYYHVYALDFLLHARLLATRNPPETTALDKTIERMADALERLSQGGRAPSFGDDDGGRLFDGSRNRAEHLTDPLGTCAALFGRPDFKAACPQLAEETLWLLGAPGARTHDGLKAAAPHSRTLWLEASGVACFASADPLPHTLVVDAGPQGFGNAGHGHADALSAQLIVQGHVALADPGTYCYPVEVDERNAFRGTAAHNTLEVDGLDQAEAGGSFAWRSLPRVRAERWVVGHGGQLLVASHDGYARLADPVIHRRWVASLGGGLYVIRDLASGEGPHSLRLRWHLGPGFRPPDGTGACREAVAYQMRCEGPDEIAVDLIAAEDGVASVRGGPYRIDEGLFSESYGRKSKSTVVVCEFQTELPAELVTAIAASSSRSAASGRLQGLLQKPGAFSVYRYSDGQRRILVLFRDSDAAWHWKGWSSDAVFLAIETDASGVEGRRVFLAGGRFLETARGQVFQSPRQLDCWEWLRSGDEEHVFCSDPEAVEQAKTEALEFGLAGDEGLE